MKFDNNNHIIITGNFILLYYSKHIKFFKKKVFCKFLFLT
jgi:hypothetical protein